MEAIAEFLHNRQVSLAVEMAKRALDVDPAPKGKMLEFVLVAALAEACGTKRLVDLPPFAFEELSWLGEATLGAAMTTSYTIPLPEQTVGCFLRFVLTGFN